MAVLSPIIVPVMVCMLLFNLGYPLL
jgi:hypothetical protein